MHPASASGLREAGALGSEFLRGLGLKVTVHMPKQSRFNNRSVGPPGEKPPTRPAWLLLWLAAVILVATTREASGCPFPTTNKRSPKEAERGRPAMRPGKSSTRY